MQIASIKNVFCFLRLGGPVADQLFSHGFPFIWAKWKIERYKWKGVGRYPDFPRSIFCQTEMCAPLAEPTFF